MHDEGIPLVRTQRLCNPFHVGQAVSHLDGKHVVFGEVQSGMKVLDKMKSVTLMEPKREGKPAPNQRVSLRTFANIIFCTKALTVFIRS